MNHTVSVIFMGGAGMYMYILSRRTSSGSEGFEGGSKTAGLKC